MTDAYCTIIAGSRGITDYETVVEAIESAPFDVTRVISGTARGVDTLGEEWAETTDVPIERFDPDDYAEEDNPMPAPLIRNRAMADRAEAVIAVWDGKSSGTQDMLSVAEREGLHIHLVRTDSRSLSEFL